MRKIPVPVPSGLNDVLVGSVVGEAGARQAGWVVDRIVAIEKEKAALEAAQVRELALLVDVYAGTTAEPYVATEVSLALGVSPSVARSRVEVAKGLCGSFTATLAALEHGRIDGVKARLIVEALTGIEQVGIAQRIETELLKRVDGRSVTQIRRSLAGLVMRFDPAGAKARRDAQAADRRVQVTPLGDGIGELWACGPVEGVAAFHTALDALARTARRNSDEDRTLDQLRFDLLGVIGSGILAAGTLSGLATGEQGCGSVGGWGGGPASAAAKERMSAAHAGPPPGVRAGGRRLAWLGAVRRGRCLSPASSLWRGQMAAPPTLRPGDWHPGRLRHHRPRPRPRARWCGRCPGWGLPAADLHRARRDLRPRPHPALGDRRGNLGSSPGPPPPARPTPPAHPPSHPRADNTSPPNASAGRSPATTHQLQAGQTTADKDTTPRTTPDSARGQTS